MSQDQASYVCGHSRPTMGHIENGRISLTPERIVFIVHSYGFKMDDYRKYLNAEVMRDEVIKQCKNKILDLADDKLALIKGIIDSMA